MSERIGRLPPATPLANIRAAEVRSNSSPVPTDGASSAAEERQMRRRKDAGFGVQPPRGKVMRVHAPAVQYRCPECDFITDRTMTAMAHTLAHKAVEA